jgi:amino acid transporter
MSNMIGVGPFITIPLLMSALNGPKSLLGWLLALCITIPDSLVWSELGAAMPGSGGTFEYLKTAFGPLRWGRLMAFLFIWQFILSGPMEIASGYIGFASYLSYIWPGMTKHQSWMVVIALGVFTIFLLYRKIGSIGKITIGLWFGSLFTTAIVIVLGLRHFDPKLAFDFGNEPWKFSLGFLLGLGTAARVAVYDFLGYYDVCYIGEEVRDPGKVIPRSILISLIGVAIIYVGINLSIIGTIPWREFVPAEGNRNANFIVSIFVEKFLGHKAASFFTVLVLWTAFASVFALLLGYSRIPYAAAKDGYFFKMFATLHPKKNFPHISLLVMGILSIVCGFFNLDDVIQVLVTSRILVQFIAQIFAIRAIRKHAMKMPFRMWFYPVPALIALVGWTFLFVTSNPGVIMASLGMLALGAILFVGWSAWGKTWPFQAKGASEA